jgi:tellurite resistance-related uncharacterized protein
MDEQTGRRLPAGLTLDRVTRDFNQENTPAGLRRAHQIASGVWGRLVVRSGRLGFVFEADGTEGQITVEAGQTVVIPPQTPHHVELTEAVEFAVEFYS